MGRTALVCRVGRLHKYLKVFLQSVKEMPLKATSTVTFWIPNGTSSISGTTTPNLNLFLNTAVVCLT